MIKGYETFSQHGTSQGIIPRFYLQMEDIASFGMDEEEMDLKFGAFLKSNIHDLTNFHDLFHNLKETYIDYRNGLVDGRYYKFTENSTFRHDKKNELALRSFVKNFFIDGRLLVHNLAVSKILDHGPFALKNFLIVNDKNFHKNKAECLQHLNGNIFLNILNIIEKCRDEFLSEFFNIRVDYEHNNFGLDDFVISINDERVINIKEPTLKSKNLLTSIQDYYNSILDFIEEIMVNIFYLKAAIKTNGFMRLSKNENFDYSNLDFKYTLIPNIYL